MQSIDFSNQPKTDIVSKIKIGKKPKVVLKKLDLGKINNSLQSMGNVPASPY